MRPAIRTAFSIALAATALGVLAPASQASFHEIKIREVSGITVAANDSYVELQMYAADQNHLNNGGFLKICDADCLPGPVSCGPFPMVANGANQSTVVIGDDTLPPSSTDIYCANLELASVSAAGAACWVTFLVGFNDCVSWGGAGFTGDAQLATITGDPGATAGAPFAGSLPSDVNAMRRNITAGCPTLLEAGDDTNSSAADFATVTRNPRKNSVIPTEVPCVEPSVNPPAGTPSKKKCKKGFKLVKKHGKKKCKRKKKKK
jgi:hypothetical protein